MPCCCTRVFAICELILCDDENLVLPVPVPADGTYYLHLDFMEQLIEKEAALTEGDFATFDKDDLNEQYTYQGQVKDDGGNVISFTVDGVEYDCFEFTTKKKVDEDEIYTPLPPDVLPQGPPGPPGPASPVGGSLNYIISGGTQVISTGVKEWLEWGFDAEITGWTILADQVGSIAVDIWKDSYSNYEPTVLDSITGTEKPTLSGAKKNQDLSLTSFQTTVAAGDIWLFNVDSVTDIKKVTISFRFNKI